MGGVTGFVDKSSESASSQRYATDRDFKSFVEKISSIFSDILLEKNRRADLLDRIDRAEAESRLERVRSSDEADAAELEKGEEGGGAAGIISAIVSALGAAVAKLAAAIKKIVSQLSLVARSLATVMRGLSKMLARGVGSMLIFARKFRLLRGGVLGILAGLAAAGLTVAALHALRRERGDGEAPGPEALPGEPTPEVKTYEGLGSVTRKFEGGGRGVESISTGAGDGGGVSYGEYQLSSKTGTMSQFLRSPEGRKFAPKFEGLEPGSSEFNKTYAQVAASQGAEFAKAQRDFIVRTHYEPALKTAGSLGFAVGDPRIQEAVFSASVQHGQVSKVLKMASDMASAEGRDLRSMDAGEQLPYIYKARSAYVSGLSTVPEKTKSSILGRYQREEREVSSIGTKPSGASSTQAAAAATGARPPSPAQATAAPSSPRGAPVAAAPSQPSAPAPGGAPIVSAQAPEAVPAPPVAQPPQPQATTASLSADYAELSSGEPLVIVQPIRQTLTKVIVA